MHNTLTLVEALVALDRPRLHRALDIRLSTTAGLKDWFDVADALLTQPALDAALARLTRAQLSEIPDVDRDISPETLATLVDLLCATQAGILPTTTERARQCVTELGLGNDAPDAPPSDVTVAPAESPAVQVLAERAIELTTKVDELCELVSQTGLRTIARGPFGGPGVSAVDITRLTDTLTAPHDRTMDPAELVELARMTGLLAVTENTWHVVPATSWSASDEAGRWSLLVEGWLASLPSELTAALATRNDWSLDASVPTSLVHYLDWLYPLDSGWILEDVQWQVHLADVIGLRQNGLRTHLGTLVMTDRIDEACALIRDSRPTHIDSVIVQSDLTIIAPGPLRLDLEARLRTIARIESRQTASTYRLSPELISHAMDEGVLAADILDFLNTLSSTGVPQPVEYLINDIGTKHGSVRVRAVDHVTPDLGTGSRITCSTAVLTAQLRADSSLRQLGLAPDAAEPNTTLTRFDTETVMRLLTNAKYPVALEDGDGKIVPWRARTAGKFSIHGTRVPVAAKVSAGPVSALLDRLEGVNPSTDEAWITRSVELAVRNKTPLVVVVSLSDGSEREFLIEPKSLSNGRLRGLDQRSEVERTIPIANVTALRSE